MGALGYPGIYDHFYCNDAYGCYLWRSDSGTQYAKHFVAFFCAEWVVEACEITLAALTFIE